ncbi:MAG: hypothetical protein JRF65_15330 [Deltaproteobacteria bacterium]|nr:hypothetical protein [Deltaproteobacteria bacterium]
MGIDHEDLLLRYLGYHDPQRVLNEAVLVVVVVIEEIMQLSHEQLDVYRVSPEYVRWARIRRQRELGA